MAISWLKADKPGQFPPLEHATEQGLLAAGGDLSAKRLIEAYQKGIFPWFNENDPILWWSPDPRMVLFPEQVKISKSLRRILKNNPFEIRFDTAFLDVISSCSKPRANQERGTVSSTWIHPEMISAYQKLHEMGYAHSVECWQQNQLVGGLYGVSIGKVFFGESMFSFVSNASKIALVALCQQLERWQFSLIDCQIYSEHLASMGAEEIFRTDFSQYLEEFCHIAQTPKKWELDKDLPLP